jgi:hypothetical protein
MLSGAAPETLGPIPPRGTRYAAIIPIGIGIAHLITYWTGERRERRLG